MCTTHTDRQDGGGGTRGACICKGGNVFKVTHVTHGYILASCVLYCEEEQQYLTRIIMSFCYFHRHPVMAKWPVGHNWFFMKLELIQVWLQDWIGGISLIPLEDYFKATPF